ncbi:MAG: phospholipase [endosymbiont of Galathealinum brachiosum]|uniref:Phospholipase A1 n=1 Tax=endosymbiont of Galathealinum brachiosum TaxID=2200906 RepID=A0A370DFC9_9GAMM|nr:MAG: phospholipase [endosymbiont of Galathealinum brachiosum]
MLFINMLNKNQYELFLKFVLVLALFINVVHASDLSVYEECVLSKTLNADSDKLISEIVKFCKSSDDEILSNTGLSDKISFLDARLNIDRSNQFKPFTLMAFKPNYIIPVAYNHAGYDSSLYQQIPGEEDVSFDKTEAQFQISIKTPLAVNLFNRDISLYTGYTNRSFWQVYNDKISRPFRETNHEPELWLQSISSIDLLGFDNRINMLGVSHQSNGRSNTLSRSWNRLYAKFAFEKESFVFVVKLWSRFHESSVTDDNPDITDYMGHGEFRVIFKNENHTFNFMSRNNIESKFERGATELSWSFPIGKRKDLRAYIQVFSGYGESLIDYNQSVNRVGFGISLSDWL